MYTDVRREAIILLKVSTVSALKIFTHKFLSANAQTCVLGFKQILIRGHSEGLWRGLGDLRLFMR